MDRKLTIVSNRLPIVLEKNADGGWKSRPGSGGLVTALAPVLRNRGGTWIGWPGVAVEHSDGLDAGLRRAERMAGYSLRPVLLTEEEVESYYEGFSNEILWPLFHDLPGRAYFSPPYWDAYSSANRKFAAAVAQSVPRGGFVWIHDYHLMTVAASLREAGTDVRSAFFLHIPFPSWDMFMRLPWRLQILKALLSHDLIGFQTMRDRHNFIACLKKVADPLTFRGKGQVVATSLGGRDVRIGAFPISIDFEEFSSLARSPAVEERANSIRKNLPGQQIVLGVDRLDYTKGIPERLLAFREALEQWPELHGKLTMILVVVPSRENVLAYGHLRRDVERLVARINGRFTRSGWVPVHYMYRSMDRTELLAHYRAADIALVTPLKDGMNLVAKEYCAANEEQRGVLILSEFAGAVAQLQRAALVVNPHDIAGAAAAIRAAATMDPDERHRRMSKLRKLIRRNDIYRWVDSFLSAAVSSDLTSFPRLDEFVPEEFARL